MIVYNTVTMARHKRISDAELLDVALAAMRRVGSDRLSFGRLADEVDLAASTLVQRFGTKDGLVRAVLDRAWDQLDAATTTAIADAVDGTSGVVQLLGALSQQYDDDPAQQLLLLRDDLRDPELRARGAAWFERLAGAVEQRLAMVLPDTTGLGEAVVAHWQGAVTLWMFHQDRPAGDVITAAVRRHLALLTAAAGDA